MNKVITFVLLVVIANYACAADLPDPILTPGATSPDVVRNVTLAELCHSSTSLVRNVPQKIKNQVFAEYGLQQEHRPDCTGPDHACFEMDHDCSLELGCNNDEKNLWPQAYDGTPWNAHVKDKLENELHALICAPNPTMTMRQAQQCISTDWIACYQKVFAP